MPRSTCIVGFFFLGGGGILLPAKGGGGAAGRGSSWERKLVWPNDASWCIL